MVEPITPSPNLHRDCHLIADDTRAPITRSDFEAARDERDELMKQLEIECWFAEVRTAVLAWQEAMLRFAARMDTEDIHQFVPIQVECELTQRMTAILVTTHGLRPHIDKKHHNCQHRSACTIAQAMRNSWTHTNARLLNFMTGGDNLHLTAPQMDHMPSGGNRHRIELRVAAKGLRNRTTTKQEKRLASAIGELSTDSNVDAVAVLHGHLKCINEAMAKYRKVLAVPGAARNELLKRHNLVDCFHVTISCGSEEVELGEPFSRMLSDGARLRKQNAMAPIIELIQFGHGEFRTGSLRESRDCILELLDVKGLNSWLTEEAADALNLQGFARNELCDDAPTLLKEAVTTLYRRATESEHRLRWQGWALRALATGLRAYD